MRGPPVLMGDANGDIRRSGVFCVLPSKGEAGIIVPRDVASLTSTDSRVSLSTLNVRFPSLCSWKERSRSSWRSAKGLDNGIFPFGVTSSSKLWYRPSTITTESSSAKDAIMAPAGEPYCELQMLLSEAEIGNPPSDSQEWDMRFEIRIDEREFARKRLSRHVELFRESSIWEVVSREREFVHSEEWGDCKYNKRIDGISQRTKRASCWKVSFVLRVW